jgi:hypothetical protein
MGFKDLKIQGNRHDLRDSNVPSLLKHLIHRKSTLFLLYPLVILTGTLRSMEPFITYVSMLNSNFYAISMSSNNQF